LTSVDTLDWYGSRKAVTLGVECSDAAERSIVFHVGELGKSRDRTFSVKFPGKPPIRSVWSGSIDPLDSVSYTYSSANTLLNEMILHKSMSISVEPSAEELHFPIAGLKTEAKLHGCPLPVKLLIMKKPL
jgi:hypothetical protein